MKYAVHIFFLCLFLCLPSCGSHKNNSRKTVQEYTTGSKKEFSTEKITANKILLEAKNSNIQTEIDEDITTILFDTAGNIQAIQSTRRRTGRNELENSTRRSDDVSLTERADSTDTHLATKIDAEENRESKGDSRMIQGWDWFWITSGVIAAILFLLPKAINKKK